MKYAKQLIKGFVFLTSILFASVTFAALEDITIMALGPLDGRAVVKTAQGKMQVLKVGDNVPGSQAVVKQVLTDRLVVEAKDESQPGRKITVWIYKPKKPGAKSRIQRLNKTPPEEEKSPQPTLMVPVK